MAHTSVIHMALDGSHARIMGENLDLHHHSSSVATFFVNGLAREFTASYLKFGQDVARDVGMHLDDQFSFQGRTLRLGKVEQVLDVDAKGQRHKALLRLAVWEGRRYSVHTHLYWGRSQDLFHILDQFLITETPKGIRITPKYPPRTPRHSETTILKEIPGVGLLQIKELTPEIRRALPRWEGTRVRGGELFVSKPHEDGMYFILASSSAQTVVMTDCHAGEDSLMASLAEMEVSWEPAQLS